MKIIWLTKGQFTLVDDADFEWLNQWKWYASNKITTFYAQRGKDDIYMHRLILGLEDIKIKCDHIDRNGLNNQRNNLRPATKSQNNCNSKPRKNKTSIFRGVYWCVDKNKWRASITKDNIVYALGNFTNQEAAAIAYNKKAIEFHGEFATLNNVL